ncbi:hypothetical protein LCL87_16990 [Rhodococcus hoagii]|nr:hypothetical protein [Prescottella equi]
MSIKHHDFDCADVDVEAFDGWSVLGIEMKRPKGTSTYWADDQGQLWKELGGLSVHDSGRIFIWPHEGLSGVEMDRLRGSGLEAFENAPKKSRGWTRERMKSGASYWSCSVSFSIDEDDPLARAIRAAESRMDAMSNLIRKRADRAAGEVAAA